MTKRTKLLIGLALVCLGIGGVIMEFTLNDGRGIIVTEKERQVAYLKEHEQEIIEFVKSQNAKIESVQIDWNDVRWGKGGSLFTTTYFISLYGRFNNIENSSWGIDVYYNEKTGNIDMPSMGIGSDFRVGGNLFE